MMSLDLYLGLGHGGVAARADTAFWCEHAGVEEGADALFAHAGAGARRWRKVPVRLWLSGALARPFLCGPVSGMNRWTEVIELARSTAAESTGIDALCSVTVEHWPHPRPSLAVAVATATLDAVERAAREHRVALRSVRPWWALALERSSTVASGARLMAMTDTDAMTVLGEHDDGLHTASGYMPGPSAEHADRLLARLALTAGVAADAVVRVELGRGADGLAGRLPFNVVPPR